MILRQFLQNDPVGISYLIGCGGRGVAAIVDPAGPIETYLAAAKEGGMRIGYVVDTHVHADHFSAGLELAKATGAEYVLSDRAEVDFPFRAVKDGETLPLGNVVLEVWHTPGHTPEHVSLLVRDRTRAEEVWFVLTGHTLMVGDLGRTELATSPEEGARHLFRSAKRLASLPDHVEVLPGAYAGSVCGRSLSGKPWSTIGFEKRFNAALQFSAEADFIQYMITDIPPAPPQATEIRRANSGHRSPSGA